MDEDDVDVDEVVLHGVQVVGQFVQVLVFVLEVEEVGQVVPVQVVDEEEMGPVRVVEGVQVEM